MILAILQARVSSTRLPRKVVRPILGKPMLSHQLARIKRSKMIDKLIVATSTDHSDDSLVDLCADEEVTCYRGDLNDVLSRFYHAALPYSPKYVVRLTGDCPLTDPEIIDRLIVFFLAGDYDYCSNCLDPTFPDGLDAEIFSFSCLELAWKEATLPSQREHVTPYINQQPNMFRLACMKSDRNLAYLRWTVDELVDFEFVTRVYETLYPVKPEFSTDDILMLLRDNPMLQEINSGFKRNEGYEKSLQQDKPLN